MNKLEFKKKISELKAFSGSHSPSIESVLDHFPEMVIKIDACFLSNPYATKLFMDYLKKDLISTNLFEKVLEYYPPQNREVAKYISKVTGVKSDQIFVGNGAIEIIQAILQKFVSGRICITIPTFSSYYEFINENVTPIFYNLKKSEGYLLNVDDYIDFVKSSNCKTIVLINPNNPNGGYIERLSLLKLLKEFAHLDNIILDESFIHFAYEGDEFNNVSMTSLITEFRNLVIIKSMSKDFGIAGIRCGYAILNEKKVETLLKNGYLWNVSGLAYYFFKLYSNDDFQREYEIVRKKYIQDTMEFYKDLSKIPNLTLYPSKGNFILVELPLGINSFDFTIDLLLNYNIYVRDCSDKIGLDGQFLRVASRSLEENITIVKAFDTIMKNYHVE
jgi:histidinol-phosphate/aromatic aminotransferase/cobyric acid decarboxylase-like protein